MSELLTFPKPKISNPIEVKIGIAGSDLRAWKSEKQIIHAKQAIEEILLFAQRNKKLIPPVDFSEKRDAEREEVLQVVKTFPVVNDITVVTGHCPVGEEKWYCINCKQWLWTKNIYPPQLEGTQRPFLMENHREIGCQVIKVYDKGGVDTWAEIIATELGIKKEIYPAEVKQWNDKTSFIEKYSHHSEDFPSQTIARKGYRSRNIQIAEACDVLYCIVPRTYIPTKEEIHQGILADYDEDIYCKHCNELGHPSNGGCWTKKYAEKLGKETHLVVIE